MKKFLLCLVACIAICLFSTEKAKGDCTILCDGSYITIGCGVSATSMPDFTPQHVPHDTAAPWFWDCWNAYTARLHALESQWASCQEKYPTSCGPATVTYVCAGVSTNYYCTGCVDTGCPCWTITIDVATALEDYRHCISHGPPARSISSFSGEVIQRLNDNLGANLPMPWWASNPNI